MELRGAAPSSWGTHPGFLRPNVCLLLSEKPHSFHANRTQLQGYTLHACQRSQTHTLRRWPRQHAHAHMQDTNVGSRASRVDTQDGPGTDQRCRRRNEDVKNSPFSKTSEILSISDRVSTATLPVPGWRRCDEAALLSFSRETKSAAPATSVHLFDDVTCLSVQAPREQRFGRMLLLLFENILLFFLNLWKMVCSQSSQCRRWTPLKFLCLGFHFDSFGQTSVHNRCSSWIFVDHFLLGTINSSFLGNKVISNGSTFC